MGLLFTDIALKSLDRRNIWLSCADHGVGNGVLVVVDERGDSDNSSKLLGDEVWMDYALLLDLT